MQVFEGGYFRGTVLHEVKVEEARSPLTDVQGGLTCRSVRDGERGLCSRWRRMNQSSNGLYPVGREGVDEVLKFSDCFLKGLRYVLIS